MKKYFKIFCLLSALWLSGLLQARAQGTELTLSEQQKTVSELLQLIQQRSGYSIFYQNDVFDPQRKVDVFVTAQPIEKVLEQVFAGTPVKWTVSGNQIYLKKDAAQAKTSDDKRSVKGVVVDEVDKTPLIGATVLVKGTDVVAITDLDGRFSLDGVNNRTLLDVSYVGYKPREFRVGNLGELEITLTSDNELDGVVVVGAGTQKKVSVTGAIVAVNGDALKAPSSSLTSNLAGKLTGVIAVTNSGEPGSSSQFYIRGISTFGGRSTPLILLDGVEISSGDLDNLPAESIENFSILKDASATAIYGARGANGVMIITTKSGKENTKAMVNASIEQSFLQPVNVVKYADGATYMNTYNEALLSRNPAATPRYTAKQIANTASGVNPYVYPDVDWYGLMFKKFAMSQRANVNISGGGSALTYYMSLQMNHDGGLLNTPQAYSFDNNYNRWSYTFQNNIGYKITQYTKIDLRMNAQISNMKSPNVSSNDIFYQIFKNTPVTFPATFPDEDDDHIHFGSAVMSAGRFYTNPYANMLNSYKETRANKLNVSLSLDQKFDFITEGLSLTALVNFNNYSQNYFTRSLTPFLYAVDPASISEDFPQQYSTTKLQEGTEYISQSGINRYSDNIFYLDARINYARAFGEHHVTAMMMYMMREYINSVLPQRNQGFSGRATYDYGNRYLVEFNFGYNGTERLEAGKRFEFFPAMSLGWVASNEKFWMPISNVFNYFKVRSSYGLVGSDETGLNAGAPHYLYLSSVSMYGGGSFASGVTGDLTQQGPMVNSYPVSNASWERATEFDVGVDMQFFNQVNLTFDWFSTHRDRILMKRASFPAVLGYQNAIPWANVGKVDNMGFEVSANWTKQLNKDWMVDARVNFTYSRNKYVYVDEPDYPYVWQTQTGKPLDAMRGYVAEGLFKDQAEIDASADQSIFGSTVMPGDIRYRDINGDNKITAEDQVMLSPYGNMPRIQYGFGISVRWKDLDFSVFFNGSAMRNIMLTGMYPFCANDSNDNNLMKWIADSHWREGADNSNVLYPRLGTLTTQICDNLDMGCDECVMPQEWESYCSRVQWNAITPSSINGDNNYVWKIWYDGIGYCNLFLQQIDEQNPYMNPNLRAQYVCEVKFLKAWYHFRLLQLFGPIPIVDSRLDSSLPKSDFPGRSHFDFCVDYICRLLDEAAEGLPANYSNYSYYGRATSIACKAIKARVLVLAASPLWNGSFPDKSWRNTVYETPGYGKELVSATYDAAKWERARTAMREAVRAAEASGAALFSLEDSEILRKNQNIGLPVIPGLLNDASAEPFKKQVMLMRYVHCSSLNDGNTETVWGFVHQGTYVDNNSTVMSSLPHFILKNDVNTNVGGWGGLSPTLYTVEHFFTENGFLPSDDPAFCSPSEYHTSAGLANTDITKINVHRDPRYYAAISFDGDEYSTKVAAGHSLYCAMRDNTKTGYDAAIWGTRNYVVTGWLNKKWVHPNYQYTGISWNSNYSSCRVPIPIVRLAEMYLSLAECEAQCGNTTEALKYLNKVRERAGVTPWTTALLTAKNKTALQAVLDERFVECYLEGYRYYDIRRYLRGRERLAAGNWRGLNAIQTAPSFSTFNTVVNINQPFEWNDRMYLLPVSNNEVYSNPNMVQAPGY